MNETAPVPHRNDKIALAGYRRFSSTMIGLTCAVVIGACQPSSSAPTEPEVQISIEVIESQAKARYESQIYDEAGALYEDIVNREGFVTLTMSSELFRFLHF